MIRDRGKADALLFGWGDYLRRFSTLHTPEEIAEIEAACLEMEGAVEWQHPLDAKPRGCSFKVYDRNQIK